MTQSAGAVGMKLWPMATDGNMDGGRHTHVPAASCELGSGNILGAAAHVVGQEFVERASAGSPVQLRYSLPRPRPDALSTSGPAGVGTLVRPWEETPGSNSRTGA